MNRDTKQAHTAAKDAALDAELERFMDNVIGRDLFDDESRNGDWSYSIMRSVRH
jgi:hypothetical protein